MTTPSFHSLSAEEALVGGLLHDVSRLETVCERVRPDDFADERTRLLFATLVALADQNIAIDALSVLTYLEEHGQYSPELAAYFVSLVAGNVSAANVDLYANLIHDGGRRVRLTALATDLLRWCREEKADRVVAQASAALEEIARDVGTRAGPVPLSACLAETWEALEQRADGRATSPVLPLGLERFDERFRILAPGSLVVVAGRPSMGKSILALQAAATVCGQGRDVLYFSLEMTRQELTQRLLAAHGDLDYTWLQSPMMADEANWRRAMAANARLMALPGRLYLDSLEGNDLESVRRWSRWLSRRGNLGCVVIDYLQLMRLGDAATRNEAIGAVTGALKRLAVELNCPILLVSQLNRAVESRDDKRPMMADLRDSGSIEQDADVIVFVYRHEVYAPDAEGAAGVAELIVSKFRGGAPGRAFVLFEGARMRFNNRVGEMPAYVRPVGAPARREAPEFTARRRTA